MVEVETVAVTETLSAAEIRSIPQLVVLVVIRGNMTNTVPDKVPISD